MKSTTYQRENFTLELFNEALPLLKKHFDEISAFKDIPLDPDLEGYLKTDEAGMMRCFTMRTADNLLIGYAVFFVRFNPHYKNSLQAVQDIIYVHPAYRGKGGKFILWCDDQLRAEGIQVVYHHIKAAHNFGPMLERIGYKLVDLIYARRLDQ